MTPTLLARVTAELVGTMLLVATVVGSGVMATGLTDDVALQLLANSLATGAALVALIVSLQPVSAAFNPVVTLVEVALRAVPARVAAVLVAAVTVAEDEGARDRPVARRIVDQADEPLPMAGGESEAFGYGHAGPPCTAQFIARGGVASKPRPAQPRWRAPCGRGWQSRECAPRARRYSEWERPGAVLQPER